MRRITCISSFVFVAALVSFGAWDLLPFWINGPKPAASQESDSERLEELQRMIGQEIGVPYADEQSQCKLIAFGSKPCGGPGSYLVYSTARTNESRLEQLVNEFNQLTKSKGFLPTAPLH
jgi:hypothetical protein